MVDMLSQFRMLKIVHIAMHFVAKLPVLTSRLYPGATVKRNSSSHELSLLQLALPNHSNEEQFSQTALRCSLQQRQKGAAVGSQSPTSNELLKHWPKPVAAAACVARPLWNSEEHITGTWQTAATKPQQGERIRRSMDAEDTDTACFCGCCCLQKRPSHVSSASLPCLHMEGLLLR